MIERILRCIGYDDDERLGIGMGRTTGAGAEGGAFVAGLLVLVAVCMGKCCFRFAGFHGNRRILTWSATHDQDETGHYESEKFHRG